MSVPLDGLKLRAEDLEDLEVISAAVQDATFAMGDVAFDAKARRLTVLLNRFRWEQVAGEKGPFERVRSGLSLDGVLGVRSLRLRRDLPDATAWLLALSYIPDAEPPGGEVRLVLAGGGEIGVRVECVDAAMVDTGPVWRTPRLPDHALPEDA
jgi:hypothetical protein